MTSSRCGTEPPIGLIEEQFFATWSAESRASHDCFVTVLPPSFPLRVLFVKFLSRRAEADFVSRHLDSVTFLSMLAEAGEVSLHGRRTDRKRDSPPHTRTVTLRAGSFPQGKLCSSTSCACNACCLP